MNKYNLSNAKNMPSREEAESGKLWTDFLNARIKYIKAMMVLGYTEEQIASAVGVGITQCHMLMTNISHGMT